MENSFPSRQELINNQNSKGYINDIIDEVKSMDIDTLSFRGSFKPRSEIVEKQKVFTWIRVYLKDECESIDPKDVIKMTYLPTGESIEMQFVCFSKKGLQKDSDGVISYTSDEDKKSLCIMADMDIINKDNENIPFIKTLFKNSIWFEYQLLRAEEIMFENTTKDYKLDHYDIEF